MGRTPAILKPTWLPKQLLRRVFPQREEDGLAHLVLARDLSPSKVNCAGSTLHPRTLTGQPPHEQRRYPSLVYCHMAWPVTTHQLRPSFQRAYFGGKASAPSSPQDFLYRETLVLQH